MPPAFVLSQDQTLRKINLFHQRYLIRLLCDFVVNYYSLKCNFQVTSHYSIFNQQHIQHRTQQSFNITLYFYFSSSFFKVFQNFFQLARSLFSSASPLSSGDRDIKYTFLPLFQAQFQLFLHFIFRSVPCVQCGF